MGKPSVSLEVPGDRQNKVISVVITLLLGFLLGYAAAFSEHPHLWAFKKFCEVKTSELSNYRKNTEDLVNVTQAMFYRSTDQARKNCEQEWLLGAKALKEFGRTLEAMQYETSALKACNKEFGAK
jgi:hypothetical protein